MNDADLQRIIAHPETCSVEGVRALAQALHTERLKVRVAGRAMIDVGRAELAMYLIGACGATRQVSVEWLQDLKGTQW